MAQNKICPLLSAGAHKETPCIGERCALFSEEWNPHGDQVTCYQRVCAIQKIADQVEGLNNTAIGYEVEHKPLCARIKGFLYRFRRG